MPVYIANDSQTLYLGNTPDAANVRVYLGEKLVYTPFRPPEGDLLLAGPKTYLKASGDVYFDIKNSPVLAEDSLSGKNIGTGAFEISFQFQPHIGGGTRFLFDLPGVARFAYERNHGRGLMVDLNGAGYYAAADQTGGGPVHDGLNTVRLARQAKDEDVTLEINGWKATLWKTFRPWTQPTLTANNSFGLVSSSAGRNSADAQAEWHAADAKLPKPEDQYSYFGWPAGINYWWMWRLPLILNLRAITLYNRATTGALNYSKTIQFFADEQRAVPLGDPVILPDNCVSPTEIRLAKAVKTNCIYVYLSDTYGGAGGCGGLGEITLTADSYHPLPFCAGQLAFFGPEDIRNLRLRTPLA